VSTENRSTVPVSKANGVLRTPARMALAGRAIEEVMRLASSLGLRLTASEGARKVARV
jgi:hypothetical protein